jgi:hypothetical protein
MGPLLIGLLLWGGCDGCRRKPPEKAGPVKAQELTEYTFLGAQPMPHGNTPVQMGIKPGHWFTLDETLTSNFADQRGTLRHQVGVSNRAIAPTDEEPAESSPDGSTGNVLGPRGEGTVRFLPLTSERPAVLPKLRSRRFDSRLLASADVLLDSGRQAVVMGQYSSGSASTLVETGRKPVNFMGTEEYFFVVLTRRPEKLIQLQQADWVRGTIEDAAFERSARRNYRPVFIDPQGALTLPDTMLDWTSTAAVLWDDLEPKSLTPQQWQALLDWLHFGGRLLINGPAAGIELSRDRLGPLMPQQVSANEELDTAAIEKLIRGWSVPGDDSVDRQIGIANAITSRPATAGTIDPATAEVPDSGGLVLRRQIGRGQIVMTRFDLTADWLKNWRSHDSFFNAALMGRPKRQYRIAASSSTIGIESWEAIYPDLRMATFAPPWHNTGLRILSRDARLTVDRGDDESSPAQRPGRRRTGDRIPAIINMITGSQSNAAPPLPPPPATVNSQTRPTPAQRSVNPGDPSLPPLSSELVATGPQAAAISSPTPNPAPDGNANRAMSLKSEEFAAHPVQGLAGWRDDSDFASATLTTLKRESGITIPSRGFILRGLAIYLAALVPLNFLIFRILGRVEWAWFAVPIIGLIGAALIARNANLDIGFARSQTEIALIEAHAGYPRAHATRFVSIYNSLSREYDFAFDSGDAAAAPVGVLFPISDADENDEIVFRQGYGDGPVMAGAGVASNRTRVFHVEQMIDLGGPITLDSQRIALTNASSFPLSDAVIVEKATDGTIRHAMIGNLTPGARVNLQWSTGDLPPITDRASTAESGPSEISLQPLIQPLASSRRFPAGSIRLVARTPQAIPGMTITPAAPQQKRSAAIVVHLALPTPVPTAKDVNLPPPRKAESQDDP